MVAIAAAFGLAIGNLYPFLAVKAPLPSADILVVEGWLPDYAIEAAKGEFSRGNYRLLITTGLPLPRGYYLAEYKTFAELAAATLKKLDFDPEKLVAVPGPEVLRNRTYTSALALRQWLSSSEPEVNSINLYTLGPHARRSWLLYKRALSPPIQVGIIAAKPLDYEPETWWQTSEGVRTAISEALGYLYARFF